MLPGMKAALEQARAHIEAGFSLQSKGDAQAARKAYEAALRLVAEHPTALQLLGLLARQDGDLAGARDLMRRSLAVHPQQPHVWNNLANTLEDLGQREAALDSLSRAIALQPDYAEAHYNRARMLFALERHKQAHESLTTAIEASGGKVASHWRLLSQMQVAQGALEAGLQTLAGALERLGEDASLRHDQGVLLQRLNRPEQSLAAHDRALALGLQAADAHYNRGNTLQSLGALQEAELSYERALAVDPLHVLTHLDLARLRWRLGQPQWLERLQTAGEQAREQRPQAAAELHGMRGQLLWRAEQLDEALMAYRAAFEADARPEYLDGVARCLVRCGDPEGGLQAHRQALSLAPHEPALQASYATSLVVAGRIQDAVGPTREALQRAPHDQYIWALLSLIGRATKPGMAEPLLDPALLHVIDLPTPLGYTDLAAFNADLAKELTVLHVDRREPVDQTLRGGTQTLGNLLDLEVPAIMMLRQAMTPAIDAWVQALRVQPDHPLRGRATGRWRYTDSWSSRLQSGGRHTNHVHPHGWVSAVYYVEVPPACEDSGPQEGWLQFGQPEPDMAAQFPPLRTVQPQVGRLVLFPSYWWHGTRPFADAQPRTTIAFDLLPA